MRVLSSKPALILFVTLAALLLCAGGASAQAFVPGVDADGELDNDLGAVGTCHPLRRNSIGGPSICRAQVTNLSGRPFHLVVIIDEEKFRLIQITQISPTGQAVVVRILLRG